MLSIYVVLHALTQQPLLLFRGKQTSSTLCLAGGESFKPFAARCLVQQAPTTIFLIGNSRVLAPS